MKKNENIDIDRDDLQEFFIHHLNKIYTAKTLLISELPKLTDNVNFADLRDAINDTIDAVKVQILRMDRVYDELSMSVAKASSTGLQGLIEDSFEDIRFYSANPELRDMSILFYLHNIESMEMASFQILEMAAVKLKNDMVKRLIKENYEDAKADRTLFLLISAKYISTV